MVSRAPTFKKWGVSIDEIRRLRTSTKDVHFVNPIGGHHRVKGAKKHIMRY